MEAWRLTGISERSCLFQLLEWNIYRISMNRIKPSTPRLFFTPSLRALHHPSFQVVTISSQVMIHIVTTLLGWWSCMLAVFLATVQSTLPNNPKTASSEKKGRNKFSNQRSRCTKWVVHAQVNGDRDRYDTHSMYISLFWIKCTHKTNGYRMTTFLRKLMSILQFSQDGTIDVSLISNNS